MAKNPAFPFYANDYLVDTLRWSRGMKSLHVDLMAESWSNKEIRDENGYPEGLNEEDRNLWVKIKHKWVLVNGVWINEKLEEVRASKKSFFKKQAENGQKGGRPPKEKPKQNPSLSKTETQTKPFHIEEEKEIEKEEEKEIEIKGVQGENESPDNWHSEQVEQSIERAFTPAYIKRLKTEGFQAYPGIDFNQELDRFKLKARGSPEKYSSHGLGLRQAFELQLRNAKPTNGKGTNSNSKQDQLNDLLADHFATYGGASSG